MADRDEPRLSNAAMRILREALDAIEIARARELEARVAGCLLTDRIRLIAGKASAATSSEESHVSACTRCAARVRAFRGGTLSSFAVAKANKENPHGQDDEASNMPKERMK